MESLEHDGDSFNSDFYPGGERVGIAGGWHELPEHLEPDDPRWPGNVKLDDPDPFEHDMNTLAACTVEARRLRELVPGASVTVRREVGSFVSDFGDTQCVEWIAIIGIGKVQGSCRAEAGKMMTLCEVADAALADYRARALDAGAEKGQVAA